MLLIFMFFINFIYTILDNIQKHNTMKKLKYKFDPSIEMEKQIREQIYHAIQGPIVKEILKKISQTEEDLYWRNLMEGSSMKVEKDLLPDFFELCQEVKTKLGVTEKVDFYITGNSEVNAFSVASDSKKEPSIVNINSALFNLMTTDELKFVIGHELGHLINKDSSLMKLTSFVFPGGSKIPISLNYKIILHSQLAELVADRYGYLACEDLGVCVSAFYKMSSGLDLVKMNVSIDTLIADNSKRLDYFLSEQGLSRESHPVNPIRVQALNLYANSPSDAELTKGMDELTSILLRIGNGEISKYIANFIASAGIMAASANENITDEEIEEIIDNLSYHTMFPQKYLDEIVKGDVLAICTEAITNIERLDPSLKESMLNYVIDIVMSDNSIDQKEIDFVYEIGNALRFSELQIAQIIANEIQAKFIPSIYDIC